MTTTAKIGSHVAAAQRERSARPDKWTVISAVALLMTAALTAVLLPEERRHIDTAGRRIPLRNGSHDTAAPEAAGENDRRRQASSPSEIPARGWKDILLRVYSNISEHRVLALAAGMTYYSLLAIFPALAALVAIYGLFSDPTAIARHLD